MGLVLAPRHDPGCPAVDFRLRKGVVTVRGAAHFAGMGTGQNNPGVGVEKVRIEILVNLTLSVVGLLGGGSKGEVGGKFTKLEGPGQVMGIGIGVDLYGSGSPIAPEARGSLERRQGAMKVDTIAPGHLILVIRQAGAFSQDQAPAAPIKDVKMRRSGYR